jgi:uncharacterized protein YidB (DUF937 family)
MKVAPETFQLLSKLGLSPRELRQTLKVGIQTRIDKLTAQGDTKPGKSNARARVIQKRRLRALLTQF